MPAQQESWIATAFLQSGTISTGEVACLNAAGTKYIPATLANRTTASRPPACIALSDGDADDPGGSGFEAQYVGVVPPAISLLGTGTATYVNVSDAGYLARTNTFDTSVVGRCDTDGTAYVCFPLAGIGPGGGGFIAGGDLTGTSTTQTVAKIQGVAISGTAASGKTLVASGAAAASWQTPSSGAAPAGATGDIQVKQDATTFNVVGFWTAQDNVGKLRATYWDPVDGVTLRSCIEVSGGGAPFWPSEQYPSYGLFRLADSFHSTGGWSFLTVHDGSNTRGLLGLSLGNYFVGDSTGNIPTTIYGYSVQIVAGAGGASVQGGLAAGSLTLTTALSAANGGTGLTAPGTSGNVLTSNGSAWVSSAPAAGLTLAGSSGQIQNNNGAGNLGAPGPYMGAAYVSIISGTPTNSGFRMGNTHRVAGRKSDGSADLDLCQLDASDVAIIGSLSANTSVRALGTLTLATNSGSTTAILTSSKFSVNVPIELGTGTLATAGLIRTQEGPAEPFWKAGAKVYIDAQVNEMTIGCDKSYANATSNVRIYPSALAVMGIAGNNYVACATGGTITLSQTTQLGATVSVGGGVRVLGIANATTDPTSNPTAGGILYVSSGALKYRGSGGTTTPVAPAEPHCPKCGTDVGIMGAENELFGEEILICRMCEARTGNGVVMTIANFFEYRKAA